MMNSEKKKHIPRPKNCFMTYRQAKMEDILKTHGKINNKDISKLAGEMWNQEPEIIKEHFRKLAELGKIEHAKKYPNYKYCPRKNQSNTKKKYNQNKENQLIQTIDYHHPECLVNNMEYEHKLYKLLHTQELFTNSYVPMQPYAPYNEAFMDNGCMVNYVSEDVFNQYINVELLDNNLEVRSETSSDSYLYPYPYLSTSNSVPLSNQDEIVQYYSPNLLNHNSYMLNYY